MNRALSDADISAVLFCFNEARYIEKAIRSLQNQSVAVDEIIVVDDYSTDGTVDIVKKMASVDKRISCLNNAYEKGKVGAYQTGLEAVRTEFFFVMGADDEANPDLVNISLKYFENIKTPFFFHSAELIDENSSPLGRTFVSSFDLETCFYYNKTGGLIFARREAIRNFIPFPEQLEFEDWYTVLTLYQHYGVIETCSVPLVRYRIHSESDSQASRWNWHRRLGLLERDLRFLRLMQQRVTNDSFKSKLQHSILFRERLIRGLPTLDKGVRISMALLKTYFSLALSRFRTSMVDKRVRLEK